MHLRNRLVLLLSLVPFLAVGNSSVYRLEIDSLIDGQSAVLTLFHRNGSFHHGYATLPGRDNLVHEVDPTPAQPIAFQYRDGRTLDVPERLRQRYAYKQPDFGGYRDAYNAGELDLNHPRPAPALTLTSDGHLQGHLDLMFYETDVPNTGGRQDDALVFRLLIDARLAADGGIAGTATAWHYPNGDYDYGADQPRRTLALSGRRVDDAWTPSARDAFAPGKDWPQVYGPFGNGSAYNTDAELIDDLADARLVWVAEERIGGGRGSGSRRADFAMFPQPWTGYGYGGYATPAVVDGKVYLHHMFADRAVLEKIEGIDRDIFLRLGNPIESLANDYKAYRDAVLCLDARTGQTLWHWKGEATFGNIPSSKGGRGTTTAVADGRIYVVGHGGLYCLDAATGALLWQKGGEERIGFGSGGGTWSREMSPVLVGGSIVLIRDGAVVGIDPKDGSLRWVLPQAAGDGAVAQRIVLDGRELLVCLGEVSPISAKDLKANPDLKPALEDLLLIDPMTGDVLLRSQALASSNLQPLVWNDIVMANGIRDLVDPFAKKDKNVPKDRERLAAVRLSLSGAERLWQQDEVHWPPFRATPVTHKGVAYIDSATGFTATDIQTGRLLGRHPKLHALAGGDHNWTWHVATNNRIITSGLLMFSTADEGFDQLPGRLSLPVAQGYMCPVKPALADGRIVLRLENTIVCYDLRRDPQIAAAREIQLVADKAVPGLGPDRDATIQIRLRERGGSLLSIGASRPALLSADRLGLPDWLSETRHAPWQRSIPSRLVRDDDGIRGPTTLRLGYNHEDWSLDLQRTPAGYAGSYTRRATPLQKPIAVQAELTGEHLLRPDGGSVWAVSLPGFVGGPNELAEGKTPEALSLIIRVSPDGRVLGGLAHSGRTNTQPWELDPGSLALTESRLRGNCTVLIRDDEYQDVHFERAREQFRRSADGGMLAIDVSLDAGLLNGQVTGKAEGTVGAAWERSGRLDEILNTP